MTYNYGDVMPLTTTLTTTDPRTNALLTLSRVVIDNEDYTVYDYQLEGLTLSVTSLKEGKATRGHSHSDAEVYFLQSDCVVRIGHKTYECKKGQVLMVGPRQYHRVYALPKQTARFVCVFSGTRDQKKATYGK